MVEIDRKMVGRDAVSDRAKKLEVVRNREDLVRRVLAAQFIASVVEMMVRLTGDCAGLDVVVK